jgi:tRNA acetyltransferase TAN1
VRTNAECLVFVKTREPINPVSLVHQICKDSQAAISATQTRYVNRLTPISLIGKATEKSLDEVARTVLAKHFRLRADDKATEAAEDESELCSVRTLLLYLHGGVLALTAC